MKKNIKNLLLLKSKKEEITETPEIKQWLDKFREEREFDGIKQSTINNDIGRLRVFLNFCYGRLNKSPDKLTNPDFVRFFNYLEKEKKISKNTQQKYFFLLKVFYKLMRLPNFREFADESYERKRFSKYEIKHYDAIDGKLLNIILEKIMETESNTSIRNSLIIRLLWDTGCRISEILNLKYKDCDFEEGTFKIRNTKGREERTVVCSSDTLEALRLYIQHQVKNSPEDYVFKTIKGNKISRNTMSHMFSSVVKELKKEGKLPHNKRIVIHSLRHGRAVDLLNKGVSLDEVKELLGHKSLDTTLFYSHSKERIDLKKIRKLL